MTLAGGDSLSELAEALDSVDVRARAEDKLNLGRLVYRERARGSSDSQTAIALTEHRGRKVSASRISQFGTTFTQLVDCRAPLTPAVFSDWLSMTETARSVDARGALMTAIRAEASEVAKAALVHSAAERFHRAFRA